MSAFVRMLRHWRRERGVALVITLLLLAILSMLASTGVRMSLGEVWMAANEQFHQRAVEAASAGAEVAVARVGIARPGASDDSWSQAVGTGSEYVVTVRRTADESVLEGSSAGRFVGQHFEIESTGTSSRGARDVQVQGVMVVSAAGGVSLFSRAGAGLSDDGVAP